MNYLEVRKIVMLTYPELIICDTGFGEDKPKEYARVSWIGESSLNLGSQQHHGQYATGTHNDTGERFHLIAVGLFGGCARSRILTLLHEVGHYDSYQDGDMLSKEFFAWKRCKELYGKFSIAWTGFENRLASRFFSSYIFHTGELDVSEYYLNKLGFGLNPLKNDDHDCVVEVSTPNLAPTYRKRANFRDNYRFWEDTKNKEFNLHRN